MKGKPHLMIGLGYYCIFSSLPLLTAIPLIGNPKGIALTGLLCAAIGARLADADKDESSINYENPVTGIPNKAINKISSMLKKIMEIAFTILLGGLIIYYGNTLAEQSKAFFNLGTYQYPAICAIGIILIVIGITDSKLIRHLPVIGWIYTLLANIINKLASYLKRAVVFIFYVGSGTALLVYNNSNMKDPITYIAGLLLIFIAIFPHRSFTHSIDGLGIFNIVISHAANIYGHPEIAYGVLIGYIAHLYLSDNLTDSGVPLFFILPKLVELIGLDKALSEHKAYQVIHKILNYRVRVPFVRSKTGTPEGDSFEYAYTTLVLIVAVVIMLNYKPIISIMG